VLAVLDSGRFADKSPAQAWAVLLDEGCYLCSIRTMYRILDGAGQLRERRAQAAHPPRIRPELVATGPDQVRTWDITKLKGPWRGLYFDLYVMLDIFSRKAVRWEVHATETGDLAKEFIENAIRANGGARPDYIHADNGTSMTSKMPGEAKDPVSAARSGCARVHRGTPLARRRSARQRGRRIRWAAYRSTRDGTGIHEST